MVLDDRTMQLPVLDYQTTEQEQAPQSGGSDSVVAGEATGAGEWCIESFAEEP